MDGARRARCAGRCRVAARRLTFTYDACDPTIVQVASWDADARVWLPLPPVAAPALNDNWGCRVLVLGDGDGFILARESYPGTISVDRWDGATWTPLGRELGKHVRGLARSPRGTLLLISGTLGILEHTDDWHVVAPPDEFEPVAMARGEEHVWSWWVRSANAAHPAGGQLRRMTLSE